VTMDRRLSPDVADQLLSGSLGREDASPLRAVAALLDATASRNVRQDPTREGPTVATMLASIEASIGGRSLRSSRPDVRPAQTSTRRFLKTKLVATITAGMLVSGTSLALAGALPSEMQRVGRTSCASSASTYPSLGPVTQPHRPRIAPGQTPEAAPNPTRSQMDPTRLDTARRSRLETEIADAGYPDLSPIRTIRVPVSQGTREIRTIRVAPFQVIKVTRTTRARSPGRMAAPEVARAARTPAAATREARGTTTLRASVACAEATATIR